MIKNKHGDIPVTILVIGVLAICAMAIFSFYFSDRGVKNDFIVIEAVEKASILKEKISFYENISMSEEEIKELFNIQDDSQTQQMYFNVTQGSLLVRYNLP